MDEQATDASRALGSDDAPGRLELRPSSPAEGSEDFGPSEPEATNRVSTREVNATERVLTRQVGEEQPALRRRKSRGT